MRVLVADDDDDNRELVAVILRRDGHTVIEATTGVAALNQFTSMLAASMTPDLVIADLWMPGMGGLSLIACIRSAGCACPTLLLTGHDDPDVRAESKALNARVMVKPFEIEDLRRIIDAFDGACVTSS
jgi:CheY-like chemotaxis protein